MDWYNASQKKEGRMPSKTQKQARTMAAAAHDPEFAAKVGIPTKTAKKFNRADKGTKKLSKAMKKSSKKRSSAKRKK
jgi:hypothetical protein